MTRAIHNEAADAIDPMLCVGYPIPLKRVAIITTLCTMADCPIESVCVSRESEDSRRITCGYYLGSNTNENGSQVVCQYQGR